MPDPPKSGIFLTMILRSISINHRYFSQKELEAFTLSSVHEVLIYATLKKECDLSGLMILSTCNRTDIYYTSRNTMPERVFDVYCQLLGVERRFSPFLASYYTYQTARHMYRVASGLDSMVVGDKQIIDQFKRSFKTAQTYKMVSTLLERAFQYALRSYKLIRNETGLLTSIESISYLSLKQAQQHLAVADSKVLILGYGEIATNFAQTLKKFKPKSVAVSGRNYSRTIDFATQFGFNATPWQQIQSVSQQSDLIIGCVSVKEPVITTDFDLASKVLVDLGVPRNIEVSVGTFNHLIAIEDLKSQLEQIRSSKVKEIKRAESLLFEELGAFMVWQERFISRKAIAS